MEMVAGGTVQGISIRMWKGSSEVDAACPAAEPGSPDESQAADHTVSHWRHALHTAILSWKLSVRKPIIWLSEAQHAVRVLQKPNACGLDHRCLEWKPPGNPREKRPRQPKGRNAARILQLPFNPADAVQTFQGGTCKASLNSCVVHADAGDLESTARGQRWCTTPCPDHQHEVIMGGSGERGLHVLLNETGACRGASGKTLPLNGLT